MHYGMRSKSFFAAREKVQCRIFITMVVHPSVRLVDFKPRWIFFFSTFQSGKKQRRSTGVSCYCLAASGKLLSTFPSAFLRFIIARRRKQNAAKCSGTWELLPPYWICASSRGMMIVHLQELTGVPWLLRFTVWGIIFFQRFVLSSWVGLNLCSLRSHMFLLIRK